LEKPALGDAWKGGAGHAATHLALAPASARRLSVLPNMLILNIERSVKSSAVKEAGSFLEMASR